MWAGRLSCLASAAQAIGSPQAEPIPKSSWKERSAWWMIQIVRGTTIKISPWVREQGAKKV